MCRFRVIDVTHMQTNKKGFTELGGTSTDLILNKKKLVQPGKINMNRLVQVAQVLTQANFQTISQAKTASAKQENAKANFQPITK